MFTLYSNLAPKVCKNIKIVTKSWGKENSWTLGSCSSAQKYKSKKTYTEECCQPTGNYKLTCKDSYGDGWHNGYIEIGGTKYCKDFQSGSEKTLDVSNSISNITSPYSIANKLYLYSYY